MAEDISKNTVVALLVLTILISVVGTLVVLEETGKISIVPKSISQPSSGGAHGAAQIHTSFQKGAIELRVIEPPSK